MARYKDKETEKVKSILSVLFSPWYGIDIGTVKQENERYVLEQEEKE